MRPRALLCVPAILLLSVPLRARRRSRDTKSAIEAYLRVIELSPGEGWGPVAERRIEELRTKEENP